MTQAAQNATREPTMEEILASIRRIIEDGNPPLGRQTDEDELRDFRQEFGGGAIGESLQHAGAMTAISEHTSTGDASPIISAAFHRADDHAPVPAEPRVEPVLAAPHEAVEPQLSGKTELVEEKAMAALEHVELVHDDHVAPEPVAETPFERHLRPILSDLAGRQVAAAFSDLSSAIEKERQQSLAQIAEDMIRPMLQEWLDNNLPTMVERLVREEIERVSRGGRQ